MQYVGLNHKQVAESRERYGSNVLTPPKRTPLWRKFLKKFADPLIVVLLIAGTMSVGISLYEFFGLHEGASVFFEPVGIFVAILLATGLAFLFETKADREFSLLNKVNDEEPVNVIRDGRPQMVPRAEVVVGDIVVLATGCEIPADGELLETSTLCVDESTLTGEPMCHKSVLPEEFDAEATFPTNHALRGTKVMEGHGIMRVLKVGDATENGKVFTAAQIETDVETPLSAQLSRLARLITNVSYACAALVIVGRLLVHFQWHPAALLLVPLTALFFWLVVARFRRWKRAWCAAAIAAFFCLFIAAVLGVHHLCGTAETLDALLAHTLGTLMIAVTLIVVTAPEGLPMAVTLSLAMSMRRMLRTQNLVRKMHACETMGATTVICTDKTGTLTQNRMTVCDWRFAQPEAADGTPHPLVAESIAVNTTAELNFHVERNVTNDDQPKRHGDVEVLGNPTEGALLLWLDAKKVQYASLKKAAAVVAEVPFSTQRKYMATLVRSAVQPGRFLLYIKGAPEIVFGFCGEPAPADWNATLAQWQSEARRTLAFAFQEFADEASARAAVDADGVLSHSLTPLGIVAIADPVREEVPAAIEECIAAGISVKIVTGDTIGTACEIGRQIGMFPEGLERLRAEGLERFVITGPDFEALSDDELRRRIRDIRIIARARPLDKRRLVETLQQLGEIVAVTGDGTNDAPALKAAHVGLSMGDGTSVAKEASDITILDGSFASIGRAVMWGRSLYQNIRRFILFQMTVNVSACLIVLGGAFLGTQSPLTVTQMLWVNLIMDTLAATALASLPPERRVMQQPPRRSGDFIISRSMWAAMLGVGLALTLVLGAVLFFFQAFDVASLDALMQAVLGGTPLCGDGGAVLTCCENATLTPYELTLFFTLFVLLQFWNLFNVRAFASRRSALSLRGCGIFLLIAAIILVGQVLIVELGGQMFQVVPLSPTDWLWLLLLTLPVLLLGEVIRLAARLFR